MTEKKRLRVALLAGGKSGEREVSLSGGKEVYKALDKEKYDVLQYDPATDLDRLVADASDLDVAFVLLHGPFGEDGTVQGFLDLLGIPYQGSGVLGSAVAMDKNLSKILYRNEGIPAPDWRMISRNDPMAPDRLMDQLGLSIVVKPVRQGSSLGMSIVHSKEELEAGLKKAFRYDQDVMVEQYIKGREITCGVIGNDDLTALPVVEIIPGETYAFFDYQAKYQAGATTEICPAELSPELTRKAHSIGIAAHRALMLKGYSRSDMIVSDRDNEIYLLETNTIPGMTPTSLLPRSAEVFGLSFSQLIDRLLELALES
ncbi:MAG: D-alanine--D-alanine ligase [Thermodesulfobacteriota bacterium]|nr:D-alanine--D-alanine ligase [Thermodesulfobacteriota bacterium]